MGDRFKHFLHNHNLTLRLDTDELCNICELNCEGWIYSCQRCSFHIHKTCAELPPQISHPFHPQHPLTIIAKQPYDSDSDSEYEDLQCHACGKVSCTPTYHCLECKFVLDLDCTALLPTKRKTESSSHKKECKNNHYTRKPHPHPLFLCETMKKTDVYCAGCKLIIQNGSIYVCLDCKRMLHKSCSELPHQLINHHFHPHHILTLLPHPPYSSGEFKCKACRGEHDGLTFHCSVCQFDLDINCAFLMPVSSTNDHQQMEQDLIDHRHPFIICNQKNEFPFICYACQQPFKYYGSSIYCCLECNVLLHKSCAQLPNEMHHPLHPSHPLTFSDCSSFVDAEKIECKACLREDYGYGYGCLDCKFFLDIPCALSKPLIVNSIFHQHRLVFCDVVAKNLRCNICNHGRKSPSFRCLECVFNFHLVCVPTLPLEASDGNHIHPLRLTKSLVRDHEDEDEQAEFYCDRCENERILHDPTYYCAECHYVAHFQCVVYEIGRFMEEQWSLNRSNLETYSSPENSIELIVRFMGEQWSLNRSNLAKSTYSSPENSSELVSRSVLIEEPEETTYHLTLHCDFHEHPLTFFGDLADDLRCNACHLYSNTYFFRCVACNFNLHCLCLQTIPSKFHHQFHMHPLILSPIKDIKNHPFEFFCEVCERDIEPIGQIYHCVECNCSSHVRCVIPKTLEEIEEVEEVWSLPYQLGDNKDDRDDEIVALTTKINDQKQKLKDLREKYVSHDEFILEQLEIKKEELVDKRRSSSALQNESTTDSIAYPLVQMEDLRSFLACLNWLRGV